MLLTSGYLLACTIRPVSSSQGNIVSFTVTDSCSHYTRVPTRLGMNHSVSGGGFDFLKFVRLTWKYVCTCVRPSTRLIVLVGLK